MLIHGIDISIKVGFIACGPGAPMAAAEIISHFGARPEADLKQLVQL